MINEQREISALNREVGQAIGLLSLLKTTHRDNLDDRTVSIIESFIDKVESRETYLE